MRKLGLATDSSLGHWQALPLLDVVNQLRAQRLSEIELASVAAESLESHLLAAGTTRADGVKILVGREAIVAAHRELMDSATQGNLLLRQAAICTVRANITEEALTIEPEWQALERNVILRCVYHPGFDTDRLAELGCSPRRANSRAPHLFR